ncbi:hypothetical protein BDA99DRAFT_536266 [Phascolomyces articulosus]|uniref:Lipocalin/cytosolic fatty-acid binding domain-containing protein n=1 Tax=Phascolomyces articulosus TaxID=60185 RepID=A0AAD5KHS6_9FUNG|nr:hypothetical protein BDA99DRAFT_536266 [Phascolomyces articulosus]
MKGLFALSTLIVAASSAVNGFVLPRQTNDDLSHFQGEWYEIGVTHNFNQMMQDIEDKYGFGCYCTRTSLESSGDQSCEMSSVCEVRNDSSVIGDATATGTFDLKSVNGDRFTFDFTFGKLTLTPADNPGHEQELPGYPSSDQSHELQGEVISTEHGTSFVVWSEYDGQVYGSLSHSERTVDDATFDQIVSQIDDTSIRDSMERYIYACE